MLTLRFQRVGRRNDPAFRLVAVERRSKPQSGGIEVLGSYHPKTKASRLNAERVRYWISQGAKTSSSVHNFLVRQGVIQAKKIHVAKTRPKAESKKLNANAGQPVGKANE